MDVCSCFRAIETQSARRLRLLLVMCHEDQVGLQAFTNKDGRRPAHMMLWSAVESFTGCRKCRNMKDLIEHALNVAKLKRVRYADIRIVDRREQVVSVKNGHVDGIGDLDSYGFGVRVLVNNSWGFASSAYLNNPEIERVTALAVQIAKASGAVSAERVELGDPVRTIGKYQTPITVDPFTVSLEEKLDLLFRSDAIMRRNAGVKVSESNVIAVRTHKFFGNTEGAFLEQTIYECGGAIAATAVNDTEVQIRSHPNSFRYQGTAGWEYVTDADFIGNAERVAEESVKLIFADVCPTKETTLVLGSSQLALQIHESCGHPAELDRVFGTEAAFAGRSFLTTDKRENFRYGSEIVNLTADSIRATGLGTFGWDDEGIAASATPLVKDGEFAGYLMSRETASQLNLKSNGCMRAESWNRLPLIRMTNVSLEPGAWELEDIIADTDDGIYMETNRSWSIDDVRLNFQFGTEFGYEIKNGKRGRLLKNCTYAGITPEFWSSCDAIANEKHWTLWGTPNCGKGEPMQTMGTGHGASPARFRNVKVGIFQ
jgi:TldD protein